MIDHMKAFVDSSKHNITLVYNPFYAQMNSIGSLWFARDFLNEDVFITNGDTFFEKNIYIKLLQNENSYIFGIDESKKNDADYRVVLSEDEVLDMGKDISEQDTMAEYIGIALIKKHGIDLFKLLLENTVKSGNYNLWWEDLFVELLAKNQKISSVDVTGYIWFEVDEVKDYRKNQRFF
jgi:choline kinase